MRICSNFFKLSRNKLFHPLKPSLRNIKFIFPSPHILLFIPLLLHLSPPIFTTHCLFSFPPATMASIPPFLFLLAFLLFPFIASYLFFLFPCRAMTTYPYLCVPFNCNNYFKHNISYLLWYSAQPNYCGHPTFKLNCDNDHMATMNIQSQKFCVINFSQDSLA